MGVQEKKEKANRHSIKLPMETIHKVRQRRMEVEGPTGKPLGIGQLVNHFVETGLKYHTAKDVQRLIK